MRLVDLPWIGGGTVTIDADRIVAIYDGAWMSAKPPRRGSADMVPHTSPDGWTRISEMHAAPRHSCTIDLDGATPVVVNRSRQDVLELCALSPVKDGDLVDGITTVEQAKDEMTCRIGGHEHSGEVLDRPFTRRADDSTFYLRCCDECFHAITKVPRTK